MTARPWLRLALPLVTLALPASAQDASAPDGYARMDALLRAVVRPGGVDYRALRHRITELRAAHAWFGEHGPGVTPGLFPTRASREAYWLNAYNLTVLRAVAEAPASMRNVLTHLPDAGFFRARAWRLDGRALTLDAVEHREIRAAFHDARVHFALNCGARGCPALRARIYTPEDLDAQLDAQTRRHLNAPGSVRVDVAARRLTLSQLFAWFADDFAAPIPGRARRELAGAPGFLLAFADPPLRAAITAACASDAGACSIAYVPYDWTLNDEDPGHSAHD